VSQIAFPAGAKIRRVSWSLDRPAQVNRSAYTGARRVVANPWHGKWSARVELSTIVGEGNVRPWRAFLAKLKGQINTFGLTATEGPQHAAANPTLASAAAQGATSVTLASSPPLTAGMFATFVYASGNNQLVQLTADIAAGVISFEPPLREAYSAGWTVETKVPWALVALTDSVVGWSVDAGQLYGISFDVEEAF
jgi:hypothetical protein